MVYPTPSGSLGLDVKTEQTNFEVVEWKNLSFITKACICFIDFTHLHLY